ncbi:MAG: hypothetical protein RQ754_08715 [Desulfuromonadales bacterium]|nr:hypothetical protein [Desulfuromonadales bacterium]
MSAPREYLLAVDVGLHTGLALFAANGKLLWYRSHHLSSPGKLKRIITRLLDSPPQPTRLIVEGSGPLADSWVREAERRDLPCSQINAEDWRSKLLLPRQQRHSRQAKQAAIKMAGLAIPLLGGKQPTTLRHDTAEAVLLGVYGLLELGWLADGPTKQLLSRHNN